MALAPRPCPACASRTTPAGCELPEMMFGLGERFDYLTCADCASLFIREVPDDLAAYYSAPYYSLEVDPEVVLGRPGVKQLVALLGRSTLFGSGRVSRTARVVPVRQLRTLVTLLESVRLAGLPGGRDTRVLDVGCGAGALVFALGLAGMRSVTGVDPFLAADRTLSTGAPVLRRTVDDLDGSFDLVMLHHSLEHVPDPGATLEAVARRLSPDGRVLVRMPTVSSAAYERYGHDWIQLDPPRHLTLFSRAGMETLARSTGFAVEAVADDSSSFQFWGSEQVRRGTSLMAPDSHFVNPSGSAFTRALLRAWDREADELNRAGRGDQAAWVLRPVAAG